MADVVITGAVGAEPLTSLASWKEASRLLRKGDDTQVDALYPRVLKTIEWYTDFGKSVVGQRHEKI